MATVTDEQITAARSVDLLSYLQTHEPGSIKKAGRNRYCLLEHDSLIISNGKWFWFSRDIGGNNALDFLIQVRGMEFKEAVGILADGRVAPVVFSAPHSPPEQEKPRPLLALPIPNENNHRAIAYLMGRGISKAVIDYCIAGKTLYESREQHNCVFVGRNAEDKVRFAAQRSTSGDWKKDLTGSDKRYSFAIPATPESQPALYVFEAPVDLLSYATMRHEKNPVQWNMIHYLSLGGTSPRALEQYLEDHPGIKNVTLCLDNDAPGREASVKIRAMLDKRGYGGMDLPPPSGKDYNQHLQNIRQEQKDAGRSVKDAAISF